MQQAPAASVEDPVFKKHIQLLIESEKYNLNHLAQQVEEGMDGWTTKMPFIRSRPEVLQMRKTKAILNAFTAAERENPSLIGQTEKIRAAGTAKESVETVNSILDTYEQASNIQRWLRARHKRGQKLPRSQEELAELARDPRGLTVAKFVSPPPSIQAKQKAIGMKQSKKPLLF